jgi:lipoate-protein ligase A
VHVPYLCVGRFVVGWGQSPPTVVVGIGGKVPELVDVGRAAGRGVPVLRRFTGGGTVVVDQSTLFASIIGDMVRSAVAARV